MKSNLNELYPNIFTRKSTRSFLDMPLKKEDLHTIFDRIKTFRSLPSIDQNWQIIYELDDGKKLYNVNAPAYFVFIIKKNPLFFVQTGYVMQQLDLFCSLMGIGTCWIGLSRAKPIKDDDDIYETIRMAVGYAKKDVHRKYKDQFKRFPLDIIANNHRYKDIIEAARMAPSSLNSQPWYFTSDEGTITLSKRRSLQPHNIFSQRFIEINCGIALLHVVTALENKGIRYEMIINKQPQQDKSWIAKIQLETELS